MPLELSGLLILRDNLAVALRDANEWILQHCFYCKIVERVRLIRDYKRN